MKRSFLTAFAALFLFALPLFAQTKTTITDHLVGPGGSPVIGNVTITAAQTFTSSDGYVVSLGQSSYVTLSTAGVLTVQLIPNLGGTPSGTWYSVSYKTSTTTVKETWIVPVSGAPVNLLTVRALNPPSPAITIPFPQNVPPPNCNDHMVPVWIANPGQWSCGNPNVGAVTFDLENPTAADAGKFQWKPKNSLVITRISCSVDSGTASVNLDVRQEASPNSSGTQVLSTPLTCTTTTGATTAVVNPNVPSLSPVALLVISASGASVVRIHAEYQLSP